MRCSCSQALSVLVVSRVAFLRRVPLSMVPYLETRGAMGRQEAPSPGPGCVFMVIRPGLHPRSDLRCCPRGLLFWAQVQRECLYLIKLTWSLGSFLSQGGGGWGQAQGLARCLSLVIIYLQTRLCNAHGQNWSSAPLGRMHLHDLSAYVIVSLGKTGRVVC